MKLFVNGEHIEALAGETIRDVARRAGHFIPALCYAKGAKHAAACMVCAVENRANGQILPSCSTLPMEGMQIETDNEAVRHVRSLSLELLLSDHRADCEAPCSLVCPSGLEIEQMLACYDAGQYQSAYNIIAQAAPACDSCKAPCEKACRRGTIDQPVAIREIIREISGMFDSVFPEHDKQLITTDKKAFQSRLGRFSSQEKRHLQATVDGKSRCLHCACAGRTDCKLRRYATDEGIKRPQYGLSSALPAMAKTHIINSLWFEPAKCIRCGLCVYNSENGFTFRDRGFGMQVVLPEENRANIREALANLCPTGAIYVDRM